MCNVQLSATSHMIDTITEELNMMLSLYSDFAKESISKRLDLTTSHMPIFKSDSVSQTGLQAIDINLLDEGIR